MSTTPPRPDSTHSSISRPRWCRAEESSSSAEAVRAQSSLMRRARFVAKHQRDEQAVERRLGVSDQLRRLPRIEMAAPCQLRALVDEGPAEAEESLDRVAQRCA